MHRDLMYIDGEWTEGRHPGRWLGIEDPSTGETFAEVPDGIPADADDAVAAARRAFDEGPWPHLTPHDRRDHLLRLEAALTRMSSRLVRLLARELGSPIRLAEMLHMAGALGSLQEFSDQALLLNESSSRPISHFPNFGQSEIRRVPIGVCVGFVPFNASLLLGVWKLAPALAMGNTVVLKGSPLAPLGVSELARACEEAGFPPGVVNIVHGDASVGERLVRHPGVDRVSFTGSTTVGRRIMELAAGTIKNLTLELGGKSPSIILPDADLELAVRGSVFGAFLASGQGCACTTRLFVHDSVYDDTLDLLRERTSELVVGHWDDFATDIGPLISGPQVLKVEEYVNGAVEEGAKVLVGGGRPDLPGGYYYEPTILVDVANSSRVACDEIFGPVLSVIRYETEAEAVRLANDSIYGLAGAVWGSDLSHAREIALKLRAGTVWVNDFGVLHPGIPFGGFRQSGIGRELGSAGALDCTEIQHVYTALDQTLDSRPYSLVSAAWD